MKLNKQKKLAVLTASMAMFIGIANAQIDSSLLKQPSTEDSARKPVLAMDAIYNRPFLTSNKAPVSIGGYAETNWQYLATSGGVTAGNQFEFRRLSFFVSSAISKRVKFMSEVEYENDPTGDPGESSGGHFDIEYAAMDVEFNPLLNLRAGIVVNPIGAFNQNHDGPKWEFTDRPIAMTQMLPDTWSNAGFGLYGKKYINHWMFGYEFYLTGGFNDSIIDNTQGKTFLPAANNNLSRLTSSASGEPMYTGKISLRNDKIGELGLSFMSDVYNTWRVEGSVVDSKRHVNVFDVDFNTTLPKLNTFITTEWAWIFVQLPPDYTPQYGNKQFGGFTDVVQPIVRGNILGWKNATLSLAVRGEYVNWNVGRFASTGLPMHNDTWSIMPGISFRPTPQTVFRINYRHQHTSDITGNTIGDVLGTTGGFVVGIATYF